MAGKAIALRNGLRFENIMSGQKYFDDILKKHELNERLTGEDYLSVSALYEAYCEATSWKVSAPPTAFYPIHERGPGYTTRCFGVSFGDGSVGRFSLAKALTAAANS